MGVRFFISQEVLDGLVEKEQATVQDDVLSIPERGLRAKVEPAVFFLREVEGKPDPNDLVGKVKTLEAIAERGADHFRASVILGDIAYDVVEGHLGAAEDGWTWPGGEGAAAASPPADSPGHLEEPNRGLLGGTAAESLPGGVPAESLQGRGQPAAAAVPEEPAAAAGPEPAAPSEPVPASPSVGAPAAAFDIVMPEEPPGGSMDLRTSVVPPPPDGDANGIVVDVVGGDDSVLPAPAPSTGANEVIRRSSLDPERRALLKSKPGFHQASAVPPDVPDERPAGARPPQRPSRPPPGLSRLPAPAPGAGARTSRPPLPPGASRRMPTPPPAEATASPGKAADELEKILLETIRPTRRKRP
ncbi:MAG: hypothetical protein HY825_19875 [Acidobacteria bacterium]|nr:hypothetical protein [Acidobacteriota bacterium]